MHSSKLLLLLVLLSACSLCQAAKIWEQPEELDYRFKPSISYAGEDSEGKVWLVTGLPDWKKYGVFYLERVDPETGQVLKTGQYFGNVSSNYYSIYGTHFDSLGGFFLRDIHFDRNLKQIEFARHFGKKINLPQGRWISEYPIQPALGLAIRGPGVLNIAYIQGFDATRDTMIASEFGLWVLHSDAAMRYITPIDVRTGTRGESVILPFECTGSIQPLSEHRAISNTCLFNIQTGQLIKELEPGWTGEVSIYGSGIAINRGRRSSPGIQAIELESGNLLWEDEAIISDRSRIVGSNLIIPSHPNVVAKNIHTGANTFEIEFQRPVNGIYVGKNSIIIYNTNSAQLHSALNGVFIRSLSASEVPAVSDRGFVTRDNSGVYSASAVEVEGKEVVQLSKRSHTNGEIIWRKKIVRDVPEPEVGSTDFSGNNGLSVGANTLVLHWGYSRWKELRTNIISLAADTGEIYYQGNHTWLGSVNSGFGTGAHVYSAAATPRGNIMLHLLDTNTPASWSPMLVTNRGEALWNYRGHPIYGGDFVAWDENSIQRLRETDGSVIWSINNPTAALLNGHYITQSELIFPKSQRWVHPNKPTFVRVNLNTGASTEQSLDFPSGYNVADLSDFSRRVKYSLATDNSFYPDDMPASIVWTSNIGLPTIVTTSITAAAIDLSPSLRLQHVGPTVQKWGLAAATNARITSRNIDFYWAAELKPDYSGLYLWRNWSITTSNSYPQRSLTDIKFDQKNQPMHAVERSFDGESFKTWIKKFRPIIEAESLSLKLEELPRSPSRYGEHTLQVQNNGSTAVKRARLASLRVDSMRFTCTTSAGQCSPQSGEGTMSIEIDLDPGAFATIELFDAYANVGNGVVLLAPIDEVENDVSDNFVDFGAVFTRSGFEN